MVETVLGGGRNKVRCESCGGMRGRSCEGFARQKTEPGRACEASIHGGGFERGRLVRNRDRGLRPQTEPGYGLTSLSPKLFYVSLCYYSVLC